MAFLGRLIRSLPLLILSPVLLAFSVLGLALADLFWRLFGRRRQDVSTQPSTRAASIVIPNWNGRDLLEKYLPSVIAAASGNPDNEVIVVENASTDGSRELLRQRFPQVRVLEMPVNLGFGGGSNAGFRAAKNDIVILLNSDMRVDPGFLPPLLEGFSSPDVFAVSCQIFFSDPAKPREETGLTQAWWEDGGLRVRHRIDDRITTKFPCFYAGGGSSAYDRRKFLELGGFDELLAPFYLEDTDLGYLAWKRGWTVFHEPRSVVYHEHRGTIGKKFSNDYIQTILKKNFLLFCWKNIHCWKRLTAHFALNYAGALVSVVFGDEPGRASLTGILRATLQLPRAMRSRLHARSLARVDDNEAFRLPMGGYYRDRFHALPETPETLRILFVSPYPINPPVHGGGVFMYQTLRELARRAETHVIALLDHPDQIPAHLEMEQFCASAEYLVRMQGRVNTFGSIVPHAVTEFSSGDLEWRIHRLMYTRSIDVLQLEYTPLGQYSGKYHRLVSALFEHDIYFQSIARGLEHMKGTLERVRARFEYLRAIRYELNMLPGCDQIQVCTRENGNYLASFLPELRGRIKEGMRAGIDTTRYDFEASRRAERERGTMLFLGSFRHTPNQVALDWFVHKVLPYVLKSCPHARLIVVGPDQPPSHAYADFGDAVQLAGYVEDVREAFLRNAVFVCPILSGSGVRVKLLEAFAAGIPVVSTRIGAEGLAHNDGEVCYLADDPAGFAARIVRLLDNPCDAVEMTQRARREVENNWDMAVLTERLVASYRQLLAEKRKR
jgi:GT2 family glycosyltransferase/glycosyltransferase involved in cell wall biosynthesis